MVNAMSVSYGEPGGVRTPDPRLRRPVLYPAELLTHLLNAFIIITCFPFIVNQKLRIFVIFEKLILHKCYINIYFLLQM